MEHKAFGSAHKWIVKWLTMESKLDSEKNEHMIVLMDSEKVKRSMGWWCWISLSISEVMEILFKVRIPEGTWFWVVRYLKLWLWEW